MIQRFDASEWPQIPTVHVKAAGDLHVRGWAEQAFEVALDGGEHPDVSVGPEMVRIVTTGDAAVRVPQGIDLVLHAGGDAHIEETQGTVQIKQAGGDLILESVGDVEARNIGGDLRVKRALRLSCNAVGGDAQLEGVSGAIAINLAGDLHLKEGQDEMIANARGDAKVELLSPTPRIKLNCQGDIHCIVSPSARARVRVVCGGDLRLQDEERHPALSRGVHSFRIGGSENEGGSIALVGQGDVVISGVQSIDNLRSTGDTGLWADETFDRLGEEMGRLGEEMGRMGDELGREFSTLGVQIAERVGARLRAKFERAQQNAQHKAEKARRRGHAPIPPLPPVPPVPPSGVGHGRQSEATEPVSEEERLMVLRMLEEGTISAAEAETLLSALEGNHAGGA